MPTRNIHLIGAGGHALVVIDALLASGLATTSIRLHDQAPDRIGTQRLGIEVTSLDSEALKGEQFHICIGNNAIRLALGEALVGIGAQPISIIHPHSTISAMASIKPGCFVAAGAIVAPLVRVGKFSIINHRAIADHECSLASGCHIAPGAVLGGGVTIGRATLIGAGATVLPTIGIGAGVTIGAGAVVTRDVTDGAIQVGVPARNFSQR